MSATHDFRSDTITLPSASMLTSILTTSALLGDDVFSEDSPTNSLESYLASLTGTSHAVFVSSGTMGNQLALRSHLTTPPYSAICDRRSHLLVHEAGMASMFSGVTLFPVMPRNKRYLTLEDIVEDGYVQDVGDTHDAPTRVISLENTCWGRIMPLAEVERIVAWARPRGIKVHMDGARLWNACYPSVSSDSPIEASRKAVQLLRRYCGAVDSVAMCFSKSLGAPTGSILLGHEEGFIKRARHFRKALGGGMRQIGVLTAPARVAVDETFLGGECLPRANRYAREIERYWVEGLGGSVQEGLEAETNMCWLDLDKAGVTQAEWEALAKEEGVRVFDGRIVCHWQISEEGVTAIKQLMRRAMDVGNRRGPIGKKAFPSHSYSPKTPGPGDKPAKL